FDEPGAFWLVGWHGLPAGDLRTVLPAGHGSLAFLGTPASRHTHAISVAGHQCGGGRPAAGRPLSTGMDERDSRAAGFRPGARGTGCPDVLEAAAVAGGAGQWRGGWIAEQLFMRSRQ